MLAAIALVIVGVIHVLPAIGVLGAERLNTLYGIDADEHNIQVLMRHRAVLFGLLGSYFLYAAFNTDERLPALLVAWISVVSFVFLGKGQMLNAQVMRVYRIDLYLIPVLAVGTLGAIF